MPPVTQHSMKQALANGFVPFLFVFLWSTGFIGAKYGLPYADPMTFVAIRFGIVFLLMLGWAFVTQAAWPTVQQSVHIAFVGILMHAGFMGTIWQKKHGSDAPMRSGYVIQFAAAFAVTLALAVMFEPMSVRWTGAFIFALSWLIVAISIGAVALLYAMLRQGAASRVSSLFFLTPISTALIGWGMFGEDLSATALCGIAIAATGVLIAMGSR